MAQGRFLAGVLAALSILPALHRDSGAQVTDTLASLNLEKEIHLPEVPALKPSHPANAPAPSGDCTYDKPGFNFLFAYGVIPKNKLNTFCNTYTKDMGLSPSITVDFSLSKEDMDRIYRKMAEIDFFNYPDNFVEETAGERDCKMTPGIIYNFAVKNDSKIKELSWNDEICDKIEKRALKLRELIGLIMEIIKSKEAYLKPPRFR